MFHEWWWGLVSVHGIVIRFGSFFHGRLLIFLVLFFKPDSSRNKVYQSASMFQAKPALDQKKQNQPTCDFAPPTYTNESSGVLGNKPNCGSQKVSSSTVLHSRCPDLKASCYWEVPMATAEEEGPWALVASPGDDRKMSTGVDVTTLGLFC